MARQTKKKRSTKPKISVAESRKMLQALDGDFLKCREIHWWVELGFYYDAEGYIRRLFECARCGTRKRNCMDARGEYVGSTSYMHPDGYRIGSVSRQEVRGEAIRRAKVYASEKSMMANVMNNGNGKRVSLAIHGQDTRTKAST